MVEFSWYVPFRKNKKCRDSSTHSVIDILIYFDSFKGILVCVDNSSNLVLNKAEERIFSPHGASALQYGLQLIRGDNVYVLHFFNFFSFSYLMSHIFFPSSGQVPSLVWLMKQSIQALILHLFLHPL